VRSQSASDILLDASVLCHFARPGLLPALRAYLGDRARVTPEVERELLRLAARREFRQLHDYLARDGAVVRRHGKWPKRTGQLPDALKPEFTRVLELKRAVSEHERAHSGEIATVLMATHRKADLVVIDDDWGADFAAKVHGLAVMSTARLTLEMVASGALEDDEGFLVFDSATPPSVGRERYEERLREMRR